LGELKAVFNVLFGQNNLVGNAIARDYGEGVISAMNTLLGPGHL
jgi:hypothetical protein